MRRIVLVLAAALLAFQTGSASAQYSGSGVEIAPFAGYRWGGGMSTISGIRNFETSSGLAYGIGLGKRLPKNSAVEIQWTHSSGDISATTTGGLDLEGGPLRRDDIMINGYWYAYRPTSNVMPYFTLGAGSAIFDTDETSSVGRFGWNLGAGVRMDPSEKAGIRLGIRWAPVWFTTGTGVWCDPFYCYSTGTGESYDQWDVSGALILKL